MILDRRPTSEIKKAARDEGMRFLRESAVERVLNGHDDAARDQQGDVRRMSADTVVRTRSGPAPGWLASPPPSVAVEIAPTHVTALALAESGSEPRRSPATPSSRSPPASSRRRSTPPNVARRRRRSTATIKTALQKVAARARRVALVAAGHDRQGLAHPLREGAGEGPGSRPADSLAGAQGGAVPGRGRAGVLGARRRARRRRPRVHRLDGAARRGPELRARLRRRRRARGPRRPRQLQPDQRAAGRGGPVGRRLAARPRRRRLRHARRRARRATWCSSATARSAPRATRRSGAPDRDVSRGSARRRRLLARRARRRVDGRRRAGRAPAARHRGARRRPRRAARLPGRGGDARPDQRQPGSCSTRWRRRSASCCASAPADSRRHRAGGADAAHQPLHPSVLQRARRARRARPRGAASSLALTVVNVVERRAAVAAEHGALGAHARRPDARPTS